MVRLIFAAALAAVAYLGGQAVSQQIVPPIVDGIREGLQQRLGEDYTLPDFVQPAADTQPGTDKQPDTDMAQQLIWACLYALILGLGIAVVARWLGGRMFARWMTLWLFTLVVHPLNTAIETLIFTKLHGQAEMVLGGLLPCLLAALVAAVIIRPVPGRLAGLAGASGEGTLAWRLLAAWLAFPVSYLIFGMMIAPLVTEAYTQPGSMIVLPRFSTMLATQAVRSMLFLWATLAVMERWTGNRTTMWLALGWAHWALVGLAGLVMPNDILDARLRLVHALEIGADSFLYIGLVVLVIGRHASRSDETG